VKVNKKKCISRGITLHTVVGHFQLWNSFVTPVEIFLERASAIARATFIF
jgi:hypothetical protein